MRFGPIFERKTGKMPTNRQDAGLLLPGAGFEHQCQATNSFDVDHLMRTRPPSEQGLLLLHQSHSMGHDIVHTGSQKRP